MTFIKQTLKNTASLLLAVGIIGSAYAAISTVSSGDPLTADSWNQIVNKISNTDTNSDDLVTKSYVDSTISANSGGGWSNCETHFQAPTSGDSTLRCSSGKSIRSHTATCGAYKGSTTGSYLKCGITNMTTKGLWGNGSYYNSDHLSYYSASIICCDD